MAINRMTFLEALLLGLAKFEDLESWVKRWREEKGEKPPVWEFLGVPEAGYRRMEKDFYQGPAVLSRACHERNRANIFVTGPYPGELPLLRRLKLKPFFVCENGDRGPKPLGEVKVGKATVKVSASFMPSHFYDFEITRGGRTIKVGTGSGSLEMFWPSIEKIAGGPAFDAAADGRPLSPKLQKALCMV